MDKKQKIILVVAAAVLVVMILFPPYYGIDRESGGRVHAFIGYHPRWNPPSAAQVYQQLTSADPASADPARLSSFESRVNVVRLTFNVVILMAATAIALFLLREKAKGA